MWLVQTGGTEVEEWEEPLHPGPLPRLVPHYPPQSNSNCTFSPTRFHECPSRRPEPGLEQGFGSARTVASGARRLQARMHPPALHGVLRVARGSVRAVCVARGARWEPPGVSASAWPYHGAPAMSARVLLLAVLA